MCWPTNLKLESKDIESIKSSPIPQVFQITALFFMNAILYNKNVNTANSLDSEEIAQS